METEEKTEMPMADDLSAPAFIAKSLGFESRLRILSVIGQKSRSVTQIVEELDLSQPLVSHHLKELRRALLVSVKRRGPFVYYQLADKRILPIIAQLSVLAHDLLEKRNGF